MSNFSSSRNKLLYLIGKQKLPSREEIEDACTILDNDMESATEAMTSLSELYMNSKNIVLEMETVEKEFSTAYEAASRCRDSLKETLREISEILTIDLANRMNIFE